jgi:hypothetical protein
MTDVPGGAGICGREVAGVFRAIAGRTAEGGAGSG